MVTPTSRQFGYADGYPPAGQCQIFTATQEKECVAPLDGLRVRLTGPDVGMFLTLPAVTMETLDRAIAVKAAIGNGAINDQIRQNVFGQLLLHGKPVTNAWMTATWHYRGGIRRCGAESGWYGVAMCSELPLGFKTRDGDTVVVDVTFLYHHRAYSSRTSYRAMAD
jgi:hypothetical protein